MSNQTREKFLSQHQRLLEESAIPEDIVEERGYRSITTKAELRERGFGPNQLIVPTLLIPVHDVTGQIANYQHRPDTPRINSNTGKPIKYETVAGSRMTIDVPPQVRSQLGDPKIPLFITEGVRKADSAVGKGLCCIDLLGVWNFRGTNDQGGKTILPDWEYVALNNREVYIAFDSDVVTKAAVYKALRRLKGFLEQRGAKVKVIYFQPKSAQKVGLDDFLASGHTVDDMLKLATTELKKPVEDDLPNDSPYFVHQGRICFRKETKHGEEIVPLSNFDARITAQVIRDDGQETKNHFEVTGRLSDGTTLDTTKVPAREFMTMNWVADRWGADAVIAAGFQIRDRLREAVQLLSIPIPKIREYVHTGWRVIDDAWVFLHGGGGLGPDGPLGPEIVHTFLEEPLSFYSLPDPPSGEALKEAVRKSLDFLHVAPPEVICPLTAAIWRAPLGNANFTLFLFGETGKGKTALTAVAQQHFGAKMDPEHLPGNWTSTANSLEANMFLLKDVFFVIDDFVPQGSGYEVGKIHKDADRVIRAQANRSGRQRMRPDTTLRAPKRPRCLTVSTGEDIFRGRSLRARSLVVEVREGDVKWDRLTDCQKAAKAGTYAAVMSAYLCWLADDFGDIQDRVKEGVDVF